MLKLLGAVPAKRCINETFQLNSNERRRLKGKRTGKEET